MSNESQAEESKHGMKCINCIHFKVRTDILNRQGECRFDPPKSVGGIIMAPRRNQGGLVVGDPVPQVMQQSMCPVIGFEFRCSKFDSKLNYPKEVWFDNNCEFSIE